VELTPQEAATLKERVVDLIRTYTQEGKVLRFDQTGLTGGVLRLTCADQSTSEWLMSVSDKVLGDFSSKMKLVFWCDLPKPIKVWVWVEGMQPALFAQLSRQNPGLDTSRWKTVKEDVKPNKGQLLTLLIDHKSVAVLDSLGWRPYIDAGRLNFQVAGSSK
jgi:hypothetical protein